jgi:hypothetical protein
MARSSDRRPAPRLRPRQPALAHRRVVPGPPGRLLDALGPRSSAGRRRHRVRRHARRLRRAARGYEASSSRVDRSITRSPTRAGVGFDSPRNEADKQGRRAPCRTSRAPTEVASTSPRTPPADHGVAGAGGTAAAARATSSSHANPGRIRLTAHQWRRWRPVIWTTAARCTARVPSRTQGTAASCAVTTSSISPPSRRPAALTPVGVYPTVNPFPPARRRMSDRLVEERRMRPYAQREGGKGRPRGDARRAALTDVSPRYPIAYTHIAPAFFLLLVPGRLPRSCWSRCVQP